MMRLIFGFLAFVAAIFLCAFAASITFLYSTSTKGVCVWFKTSGADDFGVKVDGAWLTARKAAGENIVGLTHVDDVWQRTGIVSDLYSVGLQLDLAVAKGFKVDYRNQPWAMYGHEWLKNPAALDATIINDAKMLAGRDPKYVLYQPFAEPGAMSTLDSAGIPQPLPADVWAKELPIRTKALEAAYAHIIPLIRQHAPNLTIGISPPGWAHPQEGACWTAKFTNVVYVYDVYLSGWQDIEGIIRERYEFHKARGEKMLFAESGIADRSKVGTLEEVDVMSRIRASCTLYKIPILKWTHPGT